MIAYWFILLISVVILVKSGHCGQLEHDLLVKKDPALNIKFPLVFSPSENLGQVLQFGHEKQLGTQRQPIGQVLEYFEDLTPRELWDKHVKTYRPAVLRGLLNGSPALEKWDDEYLIEVYGDQDVLIEKKFEDRKSEPKRMSIKGFLDKYKLHNWYIVSMLPDAMKKDIKLPKPLVCSSLRENLQELNLWIGTHGTRSMLHYDADNILHCLVAGRKDWILYHPDTKSKLDFTLGRQGQGSGYSHLNVDSINLNEQLQLTEAPWEYVSLYAGDCLYLPSQYIHQVRSYNRSISATFLSYPRDYFYDDDCKNVDMDKYISLDDAYVFWGHKKGQETVDMGYGNPVNIKGSFINFYKILQSEQANLKEFLYFSYAVMGEDVINGITFYKSVFNDLDQNSDNIVDMSEIRNGDIEIFKEICRFSDLPHGPTNLELDVNNEKTDKSPDFNPRSSSHLTADAIEAREFLEMITNECGTGRYLLYPQFKACVKIFLDEPASAFVLIDTNLDGILSLKELMALPYKPLREFAKLGYRYKRNQTLQGGGMWETEEGEVGISFGTEEQIDYFCLQDLFLRLHDMADTTKIKQENFVELTKQFINQEMIDCKTDPEFLFSILDRENEGSVSKQTLGIILGFEEDTKSQAEVLEDSDIAVKKERYNMFNYYEGVHALIDAMKTYITLFEKLKSNIKPEYMENVGSEVTIEMEKTNIENLKSDESRFSDSSDDSDSSGDEDSLNLVTRDEF